MCGISLIIHTGLNKEKVRADLSEMGALQKHRGPDNQNIWVEELRDFDLTIGIGHQRLSILDLSSAANQPMISPTTQSVLAFNGEIYNYRDLAAQVADTLPNYPSKGDTGTLLALLDAYGVQVLEQLNGMWAFIYFDRKSQSLLLSRDRFGQKPLYYYCDQQQLIVSSEIKPILKISRSKFKVNANAVGRYLFQSLINSTTETFFETIHSLPSRSSAVISLKNFRPSPEFHPTTTNYWHHPMRGGLQREIENPTQALREALIHSVERHLISDVPAALFLSGGLDSCSLLAAIIASGAKPPRCFSVISASRTISEDSYIARIAAHCGITPEFLNADHNPEYYLESLGGLCLSNEQPVTSFTVAAHSDLVKMAKKMGFTVLLTGQGIDEQLGGYNKFFYIHLIDSLRRGKISQVLTQGIGALFNSAIFYEFRIAEAKRYIPFLRDWVKGSYVGESLERAQLFTLTGGQSLREREALDLFETSLPAILHYEDRMSMRHSTEMRVPFLDNEIVEILGNLPDEWHLRNGLTKYVLRKTMQPLLPREICFRKDKKGFSLPEDSWIREKFIGKFIEKFSGDALVYQLKFAKRDGVLHLLNRYRNGGAGIGSKDVFNLYCLEVWLEQFSGSLR